MTLLALLASLAVATAKSPEAPNPQLLSATVGTAFTYQGRLKDAGVPANRIYDFQFRLYNAPIASSQVGDPVFINDWPAASGFSTADVDFGSGSLNGDARWLEVSLRPDASDGAYRPDAAPVLAAVPFALARRGLRTQPNTESPNLIGGHSGNSVARGAVGATIGGGGSNPPFTNTVTDDYGTVAGGGQNNRAGDNDAAPHDASHATVCGGYANAAGGILATVGGYSNGAQELTPMPPLSLAVSITAPVPLLSHRGWFWQSGDRGLRDCCGRWLSRPVGYRYQQ